MLVFQQLAFEVGPCGIAAEGAVVCDDAVARDDERNGVAAYRSADGLCRFAADPFRKRLVGNGLSVRNPEELLPYFLLKFASVWCNGNCRGGGIPAVEILFKPLDCETHWPWKRGRCGSGYLGGMTLPSEP